MSKKPNKKRHAASSAAVKRAADEAKLADRKDRERKRMDPIARTLLLGDLVFLAICQMLDKGGAMSETMANLTTIIGVILLFIALWLQFGGGRKNGGTRLK